jgi:hypothetical protein
VGRDFVGIGRAIWQIGMPARRKTAVFSSFFREFPGHFSSRQLSGAVDLWFSTLAVDQSPQWCEQPRSWLQVAFPGDGLGSCWIIFKFEEQLEEYRRIVHCTLLHNIVQYIAVPFVLV